MAYCPKCGVEVDNTVRSCPLCDFPVPDITEGTVVVEHPEKYPAVRNMYSEYLAGIKNQVYFVVTVLLVSMILVLIVIENVFKVDHVFIDYFYAAAIASAAYFYFALGFHRWSINITGMALTTTLLTYFIQEIAGGRWYWTYALPIILLVYLNALGFHYMFKHSNRRYRIGYLPVFVLLVATSLSIGVDGIISWNMIGAVRLTWSLVTAMGCLCVAFLLQFVINRIPESTKDTIRRKFHI